MRTTTFSAFLVLSALALAIGSVARADVYIPPQDHRILLLQVQGVRVVGEHAPTADADVAVAAVTQQMQAFVQRIEACIGARDRRWTLGGRPGGVVRARVSYDRSELPTRHRVVESTLGPGARACVAEVLPSLMLRPPPRGALTLEITVGRGWARGW